MNYNKKSVEDIDVAGKRVLCRCDFNVPTKDGKITSDKRIVAALPTIEYLVKHGARVILCSHMGKPKGEVKAGAVLESRSRASVGAAGPAREDGFRRCGRERAVAGRFPERRRGHAAREHPL